MRLSNGPKFGFQTQSFNQLTKSKIPKNFNPSKISLAPIKIVWNLFWHTVCTYRIIFPRFNLLELYFRSERNTSNWNTSWEFSKYCPGQTQIHGSYWHFASLFQRWVFDNLDILEFEFDLSEPRHGPRMIKIRPKKEVKKSTESSSGWKFWKFFGRLLEILVCMIRAEFVLGRLSYALVIMTFKLLFLQSVAKQLQAAAALVYLALYVLLFTLTNIFKLDQTRSNWFKVSSSVLPSSLSTQ